jgi:hypothetical protein
MTWNPINIKQPPFHVRHSELKRYSEESAYRSVCPKCEKGILFVKRDHQTLELLAHDTCSHCGQLVIYEDKEIGGEPVKPLSPELQKKLHNFMKSVS